MLHCIFWKGFFFLKMGKDFFFLKMGKDFFFLKKGKEKEESSTGTLRAQGPLEFLEQ